MVRARLDSKRDLIVAAPFTWHGEPLKPGDPFPKEGVPAHKLSGLYGARLLDHAPDAPPEPPGPVRVEQLKGGYYLIHAAWLDEPIKARGRAEMETESKRLRDEGEPLDHHGVALTEGENAWWEVKAEWLPDPEKVQGEEAARARAAELRAEGPPPSLVTIEDRGEGKFAVNAPWLDAPVEADGQEAADAEAAKLREAGPPEGWQPPEATA